MTENQEKTFNIVPGIKMGLITPEQLTTIDQVTQKYKIPLLKITSAQRLAFIGMDDDVAEQVWQDLGEKEGVVRPAGIHYVQACPGNTHCKFGCQDAINLGEKIQASFMAMRLPAKTKIGISGCPRNCSESYIRDLGIFGQGKGWTLVFGGNGGGAPRIGDVIAKHLSTEDVISLARRCLKYYAEHAEKKERTARFMERTELQDFIAQVTG